MLAIGQTVTLEILRTAPMGLILGDDDGEVLLPTRYVPKDVEPGESVEVFLYTDSEDRPIATTEKPLAQADEFACLRVASVTKAGAFLDWGLPKDLLLPFAYQVHRVSPEERVVVRVLLDEVSQRPVATTKFQRYVDLPPEDLREGQGIEWMVFEETDLGSKAIVNGRFEGLFYKAVGEPGLKRGDSGSGYVQRIRDDGKIDLSRTPMGLAGIDRARDALLEALHQAGGKLELGDRSDPDQIRSAVGLSKKAFKRAAGALYRERKVLVADHSIELIEK